MPHFVPFRLLKKAVEFRNESLLQLFSVVFFFSDLKEVISKELYL